MSGFLDKFRQKVISSVWKEQVDTHKVKEIDDKIALGVLLWVVAEADEKFLPEEENQIREILVSYCKVDKETLPLVLASIKQAADERVDLFRFTNEITKNLNYNVKLQILDNLFRVACSDKNLNSYEIETIRKISGLLRISHKDFINSKIKIKKEFGLLDLNL